MRGARIMWNRQVLGAAAFVAMAAAGFAASSQEVGPHGYPISQTPRPEQPIPADCDRACLEHVTDQIAEAMVAHDPSRLPLSKHVRYTEGGAELKVGDGFWATASGLGNYKHYFADPAVGEIVVMRTMTEGNPRKNGL